MTQPIDTSINTKPAQRTEPTTDEVIFSVYVVRMISTLLQAFGRFFAAAGSPIAAAVDAAESAAMEGRFIEAARIIRDAAPTHPTALMVATFIHTASIRTGFVLMARHLVRITWARREYESLARKIAPHAYGAFCAVSNKSLPPALHLGDWNAIQDQHEAFFAAVAETLRRGSIEPLSGALREAEPMATAIYHRSCTEPHSIEKDDPCILLALHLASRTWECHLLKGEQTMLASSGRAESDLDAVVGLVASLQESLDVRGGQ